MMTGHLVTQIMCFGDRRSLRVHVQSKVLRNWHWLDIRIQLSVGKRAKIAAGGRKKVCLHRVQNFYTADVTNLGRRVDVPTKFCTISTNNICGSSGLNLFLVTLLTPRNLKCIPVFLSYS